MKADLVKGFRDNWIGVDKKRVGGGRGQPNKWRDRRQGRLFGCKKCSAAKMNLNDTPYKLMKMDHPGDYLHEILF